MPVIPTSFTLTLQLPQVAMACVLAAMVLCGPSLTKKLKKWCNLPWAVLVFAILCWTGWWL